MLRCAMWLTLALAACDGGTTETDLAPETDTDTDPGTADCTLIEDAFAPGLYTDSCVKRAWAEPYAGTWASATCTLTLTIPSTATPAAVFELEVIGGALAGTYAHDWEGGTGMGNDSFFQFTTDDTFTTVTAENLTAGHSDDGLTEANIRFRPYDLDSTPSWTGGYSSAESPPQEADCGALLPQ